MGEEFDLIVITKNYALAGFRLLSTVKKKTRFATVLVNIKREWSSFFSLVNILYCFLIRLWLEQKNNKCFKVDWRSPGKIEDSQKKNEIVWILCMQRLLRTFKCKARDLLSWRLPNKEPRFELFASRHFPWFELLNESSWWYSGIFLVCNELDFIQVTSSVSLLFKWWEIVGEEALFGANWWVALWKRVSRVLAVVQGLQFIMARYVLCFCVDCAA